MKAAWSEFAAGNLAAADALFRDVHQDHPAHQPAYMGLVHVARARLEHDKALALLDAWLARERQDAVALSPRMVLNYLEVSTIHGSPERAADVVSGLSLEDAGLSDAEFLRLADAADKLGLPEVIVAVVQRLATFDTLSPRAALRLLQMVNGTGKPKVVARVRATLLDRVQRDSATDLAIAFDRQDKGPIAALDTCRRLTGPVRDAGQAATLGEALLDAAEPRLALRYLRLCRRRWPEEIPICKLLVRAFLASGRPDGAEAEIATWQGAVPPDIITDARISLYSATGAIDPLRAELDRLEGRRSIPQMRLQICFAQADLEGAEALVPSVGASMGRGRQVLAHFGATHVGSVLNELRLWRRFGGDARAGARGFYFAAKEILDGQQDRLERLSAQPGMPHPPIPPQVFQYWDSPDIPPAITAIMDSWRNCPGLTYRRLDKKDAIRFLHTHYDADHVRAFRNANHAAEGSDFLRLCLLQTYGGIYADADDRLTGPVRTLLECRRGMLLFRETFGALANNLLCARAGHPVLAIAREFALSSLLARENDGPWSKTGPGLITRAVATCLSSASDDEVRRELEIRPEIQMRQVVYPHIKLPYKTTPRYWDSRFGASSKDIVQALSDAFGGEQEDETSGVPAQVVGQDTDSAVGHIGRPDQGLQYPWHPAET